MDHERQDTQGSSRGGLNGALRRSGLRLSGFTLIELLVVIAIISLLVSILLPSLRQAKELAKASICLAHMRPIVIAVNMYADEEDGYMPPYYQDWPPYSTGDSWRGPGGVTYTQWYRGVLITMWYRQGAFPDPPRDADGLLGPYLGGGTDLRTVPHCPSVPAEPKIMHLSWGMYGSGEEPHWTFREKSFGLNLFNVTGYPDPDRGTQYDMPILLDDIQNAAEMVYMCDGSARAPYAYSPDILIGYPEDNTAIAPSDRHLETCNAVFLDGHAVGDTLDNMYVERLWLDEY